MRRFSTPAVSLLAGRPVATLQSDLAAAQQAYVDLSSGSKVVNATYAQGAGSRSVTYTPADMGALQNLIRSLQQQLGITQRARAPIRPVF
ncbi:phage head-tail adapter protein [Pseudomonas lurida]|uniref:gpW family head-tail joining protein n=1 Tax=Pseudomonas lurida TaxID=244566 RepID=UPI001657290A|nr:gpW family head-tail joining protein [Pseudomonas lurida]MBC8984021.1 phage head-tail adapter protein [Pseudomonas lurida]